MLLHMNTTALETADIFGLSHPAFPTTWTASVWRSSGLHECIRGTGLVITCADLMHQQAQDKGENFQVKRNNKLRKILDADRPTTIVNCH